MANNVLLGLDVGEKRIGVSIANGVVRIASPYTTIEDASNQLKAIATLIEEHTPAKIIVGYPRNQQGERTAQTAYVEKFAQQLEGFGVPIIFQDESLTSVLAEQRLKAQQRPYTKGDIDAYAATIILQDYLELHAQ